MRTSIVLFFVFLSVGLISNSCQFCTLVRCVDRFFLVVVQNTSEPTAKGVYEIAIHADGIPRSTLEAHLPQETETVLVYPEWVFITGFGYESPWGMLNDDGQLLLDVAPFLGMERGYYAQSPEIVHVEVSSSGVVLADTDLAPDYERYWCNGSKECGGDKKHYRTEVLVLVDEPPETDTDTDSSTDTGADGAEGAAY